MRVTKEILQTKVINLLITYKTRESRRVTTLACLCRMFIKLLHCIPFRTQRRFQPGGAEAGVTWATTVVKQ
jgi:hypothetical protein